MLPLPDNLIPLLHHHLEALTLLKEAQTATVCWHEYSLLFLHEYGIPKAAQFAALIQDVANQDR